VQTIEELYKINIDNYATVNFYDMIKIIDALGGLDIDVTDEEAAVANQYYVPYLAKETGVDAADYQLTGGTVHLNGLQAVAFSRIRYTEGSDYARTERQRKVLSLMFDKVGKLSLSDLNAFLDVALPCVTHNIDEATMATLLASAPGYLSYTLVTNRVPYDGYFYEWNEMLVPDFEYTINMLHSQIYRVN
jgi:LCP family protein required for cell wall assembly